VQKGKMTVMTKEMLHVITEPGDGTRYEFLARCDCNNVLESPIWKFYGCGPGGPAKGIQYPEYINQNFVLANFNEDFLDKDADTKYLEVLEKANWLGESPYVIKVCIIFILNWVYRKNNGVKAND